MGGVATLSGGEFIYFNNIMDYQCLWINVLFNFTREGVS